VNVGLTVAVGFGEVFHTHDAHGACAVFAQGNSRACSFLIRRLLLWSYFFELYAAIDGKEIQ